MYACAAVPALGPAFLATLDAEFGVSITQFSPLTQQAVEARIPPRILFSLNCPSVSGPTASSERGHQGLLGDQRRGREQGERQGESKALIAVISDGNVFYYWPPFDCNRYIQSIGGTLG
jgi:hypothetical protein